MEKVVLCLEDARSDYIPIPCNTAQNFYDSIAANASIPVLNIMRETATHIVDRFGEGATIGLLATDGTIASGVFQQYLNQAGLRTVAPTEDEQRDVVMPLIYEHVKRNLPYDATELLRVAARLHDDGCDAVIVGCTELSVVYQDLDEKPAYLVDSMDVLADRCVEHYLACRRGASEER